MRGPGSRRSIDPSARPPDWAEDLTSPPASEAHRAHACCRGSSGGVDEAQSFELARAFLRILAVGAFFADRAVGLVQHRLTKATFRFGAPPSLSPLLLDPDVR